MREAPLNRQAERRALQGGPSHKAVRGDWGRVSEQPPLLDEASTRYPSKKKDKKAPKKERCPRNPHGHTHEWMKDTEEIPVVEHYWTTRKTFRINDDFKLEYFDVDDYRNRQVGTKARLYKLCVHCGLTLVKGKGSRRWGGKWVEACKARNYFTQYRYRGRKVVR